ncbi:MAG: LysR family transcriptional regulator [Acidobacteriota bacterium]
MSHHRIRQKRKQASALEIRHLRAFVTLVDLGSISSAARSLGLAQSTVSESLAALERVLGTPVTLRRRGAYDVSLTAAGHAFLPYARSVLASLDAAQVAVVNATNGAYATLKIITNESISTYLLPKALARLRTQWPNTRFAVSVATCLGVLAGVDDGEFDIGLRLYTDEFIDQLSPSISTTATLSLERVVVSTDIPLIIFAGMLHPLIRSRTRTPVRHDEIAEYPLFISDAAGDFYSLVCRFFESNGIPGPDLEAVGSVEGVKRGVATDPHALGILPAYAVAEDLQSRQVAALSLNLQPPRLRLEALLSRGRARHLAANELLNSLCHTFKREQQID